MFKASIKIGKEIFIVSFQKQYSKFILSEIEVQTEHYRAKIDVMDAYLLSIIEKELPKIKAYETTLSGLN